ncbi:FMN-dependent NADH-azoreductase [Marinospirillum alkaliphilum]|uniref:FMN dependent NADH:quinone oxidoreductase n=1 Tax=Marinospirillum alkaliphilum DSM 21637 TaxID=1122209 RepID=A0A1K1YTC2_9GAMM|nr:FMN-dependent NADH-azoreductase [Marinospirillum alkaliphilum]SFX65250.1 FMN-dependent NADH-azoreductase [Marinospirillum alkaliphilum DSM 21637]
MNILQIDAGLFAEQSVSRNLSKKIVTRLQEQNPGAQVILRDLIASPINHLDGEILMAGGTEAANRSERQQAELAITETLLDEVFNADVLVIGAPLYNFSIPSQLKAWVDRIAQAGRTFRYTENGPEGLLKGKRVVIASARGGVYSTGPATAMEHQESYLKTLLGFIGITDITIIRAEGVNMGDEKRAQAINAADVEIAELAEA